MTALPNPFAGLSAGTEPETAASAKPYIPEPFLAFSQRRSMPIVSPPSQGRGAQQPNRFDAVFDAGRFLADIEPAPPHEALHALLELGGSQS
jgi:hypothetical protein